MARQAFERQLEALRTVAAAYKIATDLERVGDHAVNIAARTLYMTEGDDSLLERRRFIR